MVSVIDIYPQQDGIYLITPEGVFYYIHELEGSFGYYLHEYDYGAHWYTSASLPEGYDRDIVLIDKCGTEITLLKCVCIIDTDWPIRINDMKTTHGITEFLHYINR